MEITKKRQFNDIVLGFYLLSHPVPVMLHILAVTVFTLLAAWPHFAWGIIALVIAAHAAMQISIACSMITVIAAWTPRVSPANLFHEGSSIRARRSLVASA